MQKSQRADRVPRQPKPADHNTGAARLIALLFAAEWREAPVPAEADARTSQTERARRTASARCVAGAVAGT